MAENSLSGNLIKAQLESIMASQKIPDWVLKYTSCLGNPDVREIMAKFMRQYLHSPAIQTDNIAFSAGASASLEVCSFVLANPGDVVVIPAPSYPMYTKDLGVKTKMERYDLQSHHDIDGLPTLALVTIDRLNETWKDLQSKGKIFKMLLITTPDNPTGSIYSESQLSEIADWCIAHEVHLVVNEIYALSEIIPTEEMEFSFASFSKIMATKNSPFLHLIYGLSKDFSISGLRFGIIHSLNEKAIQAIDNANIPHMVSNLTQWLIGEMFKDEAFISSYVEENKKRITRSYQLVIDTLDKLDIPYTPSRGSLFVWADFSKYLKVQSPQGEMDWWMEVYKETRVLLTPGTGFEHSKNGLFRIVHTALPSADLGVALKELENYLSVGV